MLRFLDDSLLLEDGCGMKALQLRRLIQAGYQVPPAFVIPHGLDLSALEDRELEDAVRRIGGFPVAVRSSGALEDLDAASFAGQYESYLNVPDVPTMRERVTACRASAGSERVRAYLAQHGLAPEQAKLGVIVQRMVAAQKAGVAFSIDPLTGREEHALVEVVAGLGEALVSGHASPTRYRLVLRDGSIADHEPGEQGAELGPAERKALTDALLAIQALYGRPQDVEWAIDDGGQLYILQTRAVTEVRARQDVEEFTNADFKDGGISARVCTPLMYSLYHAAMQHSMPRYLREIKLIKDGSDEIWIARFYGRGYWNASAVKRGLLKVPGFDERAFDRDLGIQKDYGKAGPIVVPTTLRTLLPALPIALALEAGYAKCLRDVAAFHPAFATRYAALRQKVAVLSDTDDRAFFADLQEVFGDFQRWVEQAYFTTIYNNANAQSDFKAFVERMDAVTGQKTQLTALMAGLDGVHHMDMQRGILALADAAQAHGLTHPAFAEALAAFIAEYGFHSDAELDLMAPRWSEVPERITARVAGIVRTGRLPADPDHALARQREAFEREMSAIRALLRAKLSLRLRFARGFEKHVARIRRFLSEREGMREQSTKAYAVTRAYALEAGRRWARAGVLPDADAVFMLEVGELEELARGRADRQALLADLRYRRLMYEGYREFPAPNELGRGVSQRTAESHRSEEDGCVVLRGVGCSPGVVEGPVRIVATLEETVALEPGEILVTRFTDPGWTPALGLVSAVVTEVGGMLSHAAVIGREYGIPAVLNLPGALAALRTGDRVRVDGEAGTVVLLSLAAGARGAEEAAA